MPTRFIKIKCFNRDVFRKNTLRVVVVEQTHRGSAFSPTYPYPRNEAYFSTGDTCSFAAANGLRLWSDTCPENYIKSEGIFFVRGIGREYDDSPQFLLEEELLTLNEAIHEYNILYMEEGA